MEMLGIIMLTVTPIIILMQTKIIMVIIMAIIVMAIIVMAIIVILD